MSTVLEHTYRVTRIIVETAEIPIRIFSGDEMIPDKEMRRIAAAQMTEDRVKREVRTDVEFVRAMTVHQQ